MLKDNEEFKSLIAHWRNMSNVFEDPIALSIKYDEKLYHLVLINNALYSLKLFYYLVLCRNYHMAATANRELLTEMTEYAESPDDINLDYLKHSVEQIFNARSDRGTGYIKIVEQYARKAALHPIVINT